MIRTAIPRAMMVLLLGGALSCGDGESVAARDADPLAGDQTVVLGGGDGARSYDSPEGDDCLQVGDSCLRPQQSCGDNGRADVVLDADGEVVRTICYPGDLAQTSTTEGTTPEPREGETIVLDGQADGVDLKGNLDIEEEGVIVFGQGPSLSYIEGNVHIEDDGEGAVLRGVRIKGDVHVEADDVSLTLCVIEGNLHLREDDTVVSDCVVLGDVHVDGDAITLLRNRVDGGWDISPESERLRCQGNARFEDSNEDGLVQDDELGEALSCRPD